MTAATLERGFRWTSNIKMGVLGVLLLCTSISGVWFFRNSQPKTFSTSPSDVPRRFPPIAKRIFPADSEQARSVAAACRVRLSVAPSGPVMCHMLRLYGQSDIPGWSLSSGSEILKILTDDSIAQEKLGKTFLLPTRTGFRYRLPIAGAVRTGTDGESHRDLFLAAFAELGLPLSTPIMHASKDGRVRDLLSDSIENFDLQQNEIAWTAIAYTIYLPDLSHWTNREGKRFDMEQLTREILSRPLASSSCGGTHLLFALTLILRSNERGHFLSTASREALRDHLKCCVGVAISAQSSDGSWTSRWERGMPILSDHESQLSKLLITGHMMEWMEYLPDDLQPPIPVYERGAAWLCRALTEVKVINAGIWVCPWTHAVCSMNNLISDCPVRDSKKHN